MVSSRIAKIVGSVPPASTSQRCKHSSFRNSAIAPAGLIGKVLKHRLSKLRNSCRNVMIVIVVIMAEAEPET
jgi:hypothetical protein